MTKAYLAIQCHDSKGILGDFLFINKFEAVTPIFPSLCDAFPAFRELGWNQLPYDPAHPCGVYVHG